MLAQAVSRMAVLVPLPDANTAAPGVNPARRHPVQLATRAGSTQRPALLISFSIQVLCTWLCTRYVHKKSAKTASRLRSRFLVCVVFFSVLPLGFRLTNRLLGDRNTRIHAADSKIRNSKITFSSLSLSCFCSRSGGHNAGFSLKEWGHGSWSLRHGKSQQKQIFKKLGKKITLKFYLITPKARGIRQELLWKTPLKTSKAAFTFPIYRRKRNCMMLRGESNLFLFFLEKGRNSHFTAQTEP